jgi:uncharacterized membrane protein
MSYKKPEPRPKLNLKPSRSDYILEAISLWLLVATFLYAWISYQNLPETIPSHFNLKGEVDDHANKAFIFFLPAVSFLLYVVLTLINFFPHTFNYPVAITPMNAPKQYRLATRVLRVLKISLTTTFALILWSVVNPQQQIFPSFLLAPMILVIVLAPVIVLIRLSFKYK